MFRRHVADLGLRSKDELATRRARWNERQEAPPGRLRSPGLPSIQPRQAGVVGRDDMKPIRQTRNEVMELVRRRGKTVQQDDGRLRRVPDLAVEGPKARNVGGLEVHKAPFPQSASKNSSMLYSVAPLRSLTPMDTTNRACLHASAWSLHALVWFTGARRILIVLPNTRFTRT
jgi:hypothetical protein